MIYINKILPIVFSPLGLIIFLLIFGSLRKIFLPVLVAAVILIVLSLPIVSRHLANSLEQNYQIVAASDVDSAEAVVVLSGMVSTIQQDGKIHYEFSGAVDRILAGIELLKLQKAKKLILTRGKLPWNIGIPEGEFLAKFAVSQGIHPNKILLTDVVQNTNDEAKLISKMLPKKTKIILVTSAFHMPRAEKIFRSQNLTVIPHAVDFLKSSKKIDLLDFLPQASAFSKSNWYFREVIGRVYYTLRYTTLAKR